MGNGDLSHTMSFCVFHMVQISIMSALAASVVASAELSLGVRSQG